MLRNRLDGDAVAFEPQRIAAILPKVEMVDDRVAGRARMAHGYQADDDRSAVTVLCQGARVADLCHHLAGGAMDTAHGITQQGAIPACSFTRP